MRPAIRAISGPVRGATFRLVQDEITIGRQPSNHLCIGDLSVSRVHCRIRFEEGRFKVTDLNSHNGTLVNGKRVAEAFLQAGDRLTIGDTTFEFVEHSASAPEFPIPVGSQETMARTFVEPPRRDAIDTPQVRPESAGPELNERAALSRIGELLNASSVVDQVQTEILSVIGRFLQAERGGLFIIRKSDWAIFAWDKQSEISSAEFVDRETIDRVFRTGKPVISGISNRSDSRAQLASSQTSVSALVVPLIVRDVITGVIYIERTGKNAFTRGDLEFVAAVSNYVAVVLDYAERVEDLQTVNRRMREEVQLQHELIGDTQPMKDVYNRIARIAPTDATVIILGETGTGKELAARALHNNSPRAGQMFEAINCALLKGDLLQSELFGHEKGAFTGAIVQKKGKLELANRGTVFLDEVAELPEGLQAMLLRVLQERTFERLGGTKKIQVDIRIVAATNRPLEEYVRTHKFRQDLYYRLNVVSIYMPPLRERREDIPLLAGRFLERTSAKNKRRVTSISPDAMAYLKGYDWPGNVRELENAIEHAVVFGLTDQLLPEDLPEAILTRIPNAAAPAINYQDAVRNAKRQIVLDALQQANGDYSKAAKVLHIHPNNLHRLIRDLDAKAHAQSSKSG